MHLDIKDPLLLIESFYDSYEKLMNFYNEEISPRIHDENDERNVWKRFERKISPISSAFCGDGHDVSIGATISIDCAMISEMNWDQLTQNIGEFSLRFKQISIQRFQLQQKLKGKPVKCSSKDFEEIFDYLQLKCPLINSSERNSIETEKIFQIVQQMKEEMMEKKWEDIRQFLFKHISNYISMNQIPSDDLELTIWNNLMKLRNVKFLQFFFKHFPISSYFQFQYSVAPQILELIMRLENEEIVDCLFHNFFLDRRIENLKDKNFFKQIFFSSIPLLNSINFPYVSNEFHKINKFDPSLFTSIIDNELFLQFLMKSTIISFQFSFMILTLRKWEKLNWESEKIIFENFFDKSISSINVDELEGKERWFFVKFSMELFLSIGNNFDFYQKFFAELFVKCLFDDRYFLEKITCQQMNEKNGWNDEFITYLLHQLFQNENLMRRKNEEEFFEFLQIFHENLRSIQFSSTEKYLYLSLEKGKRSQIIQLELFDFIDFTKITSEKLWEILKKFHGQMKEWKRGTTFYSYFLDRFQRLFIRFVNDFLFQLTISSTENGILCEIFSLHLSLKNEKFSIEQFEHFLQSFRPIDETHLIRLIYDLIVVEVHEKYCGKMCELKKENIWNLIDLLVNVDNVNKEIIFELINILLKRSSDGLILRRISKIISNLFDNIHEMNHYYHSYLTMIRLIDFSPIPLTFKFDDITFQYLYATTIVMEMKKTHPILFEMIFGMKCEKKELEMEVSWEKLLKWTHELILNSFQLLKRLENSSSLSIFIRLQLVTICQLFQMNLYQLSERLEWISNQFDNHRHSFIGQFLPNNPSTHEKILRHFSQYHHVSLSQFNKLNKQMELLIRKETKIEEIKLIPKDFHYHLKENKHFEMKQLNKQKHQPPPPPTTTTTTMMVGREKICREIPPQLFTISKKKISLSTSEYVKLMIERFVEPTIKFQKKYEEIFEIFLRNKFKRLSYQEGVVIQSFECHRNNVISNIFLKCKSAALVTFQPISGLKIEERENGKRVELNEKLWNRMKLKEMEIMKDFHQSIQYEWDVIELETRQINPNSFPIHFIIQLIHDKSKTLNEYQTIFNHLMNFFYENHKNGKSIEFHIIPIPHNFYENFKQFEQLQLNQLLSLTLDDEKRILINLLISLITDKRNISDHVDLFPYLVHFLDEYRRLGDIDNEQSKICYSLINLFSINSVIKRIISVQHLNKCLKFLMSNISFNSPPTLQQIQEDISFEANVEDEYLFVDAENSPKFFTVKFVKNLKNFIYFHILHHLHSLLIDEWSLNENLSINLNDLFHMRNEKMGCVERKLFDLSMDRIELKIEKFKGFSYSNQFLQFFIEHFHILLQHLFVDRFIRLIHSCHLANLINRIELNETIKINEYFIIFNQAQSHLFYHEKSFQSTIDFHCDIFQLFSSSSSKVEMVTILDIIQHILFNEQIENKMEIIQIYFERSTNFDYSYKINSLHQLKIVHEKLLKENINQSLLIQFYHFLPFTEILAGENEELRQYLLRILLKHWTKLEIGNLFKNEKFNQIIHQLSSTQLFLSPIFLYELVDELNFRFKNFHQIEMFSKHEISSIFRRLYSDNLKYQFRTLQLKWLREIEEFDPKLFEFSLWNLFAEIEEFDDENLFSIFFHNFCAFFEHFHNEQSVDLLSNRDIFAKENFCLICHQKADCQLNIIFHILSEFISDENFEKRFHLFEKCLERLTLANFWRSTNNFLSFVKLLNKLIDRFPDRFYRKLILKNDILPVLMELIRSHWSHLLPFIRYIAKYGEEFQSSKRMEMFIERLPHLFLKETSCQIIFEIIFNIHSSTSSIFLSLIDHIPISSQFHDYMNCKCSLKYRLFNRFISFCVENEEEIELTSFIFRILSSNDRSILQNNSFHIKLDNNCQIDWQQLQMILREMNDLQINLLSLTVNCRIWYFFHKLHELAGI
ncbi:hypothetical protein SNEBB_003148 [Seison nebaliae]|nr:hypothetical protein SNEBB_003148 [Seison nebaliae]